MGRILRYYAKVQKEFPGRISEAGSHLALNMNKDVDTFIKKLKCELARRTKILVGMDHSPLTTDQ
jgi:hypothetical protein